MYSISSPEASHSRCTVYFRPRRTVVVAPPAKRSGVSEANRPCCTRLRAWQKQMATRDRSMWASSGRRATMSRTDAAHAGGEIERRPALNLRCGGSDGLVLEHAGNRFLPGH